MGNCDYDYEYVYEYGRKTADGGALHVLIHANLPVICAPTAGFRFEFFESQFACPRSRTVCLSP